VQKYLSMTNHMWDGFWFLCNKRAWERLPEDVREIVARHINEAAVNERTDVEALNATVRGELESNGMEVNEPDTASFRQKLADAGFYAEWKKAYGDDAWAILEKAVGSSLG
jgi:TRAP-type C4-dicarboxylate transport system substrate-binding protein